MKSSRHRALQSLCAPFSPKSIAAPAHLIEHRRILITGAGGSIGSALAHAVAAHKPAQILLLDSSEQALFHIDRELVAPHTSILASVCDAPALEEVFEHQRPHIIFHAAAFKHVPLMELHPFAAVENNTIGTFTLAQTALRHRVEQLILVSTDKAVDPASIMGASKRGAELTALALQTPATKIKAVRLGNVFGSQGSAIPLFEEQIAHGKPVTVTHPDATRYFISVEHAAALLLFALSKQFPPVILVPDLASPARIEDIARILIDQNRSLSPIIYIGLRPGEKLHEQLLSANESFLSEAKASLRAISSETISTHSAVEVIEQLQAAIKDRDLSRLLGIVTQLIPAYKPSKTLLAQQTVAEYRA